MLLKVGCVSVYEMGEGEKIGFSDSNIVSP